MSVSISALKTRRLFRGVALLVAILFITGQVFNCCLVNESFARAMKGFFRHGGETALHNEDQEDAHPGCHGHAAHQETATVHSGMPTSGEPGYNQDGSCLSEQSLSAKPMVASEYAQAPLLPAVFAWVPQAEFPQAFFFERPRPQNRSSPPLYLTTLRILV